MYVMRLEMPKRKVVRKSMEATLVFHFHTFNQHFCTSCYPSIYYNERGGEDGLSN